MIKIEIITEKERYDELWKKFKSHVFQSWAWGDAYRGEILHLAYSIDGEISGILQVSIKQYIKGLIRFGIVERAKLNIQYRDEVLSELKKMIVQELLLDFIIFEFDEENTKDIQPSKLLLVSGQTNQPLHTNIIDLIPTEDELFDKIRKTYKKHRNINVAKKKGVTVVIEKANDTNAEKFYNFMYKISKERGFHFLTKDHVMGVITYLGQDDLADILFAYAEGELVGAYFVAYDEVKAYEFYGGVNLKGRKLFASYLLKWEAMLHAKSLGKVVYDQWGSAPKMANGEYDPNHHLFHIAKYKDSFGGDYFEFVPQQVMVVSKLKYQIFKLIKVFQRWKFKVGL